MTIAASSQWARKATHLRYATIKMAASSTANAPQISQVATKAASNHQPEASASMMSTGIRARVAARTTGSSGV
jgi:hypothetical protein